MLLRQSALTPLFVLAPFLACAAAQPLQDVEAGASAPATFDPDWFEGLHWRELGPYRGGRSAAVCGVPSQPNTYYFGSCGDGVWKRR